MKIVEAAMTAMIETVQKVSRRISIVMTIIVRIIVKIIVITTEVNLAVEATTGITTVVGIIRIQMIDLIRTTIDLSIIGIMNVLIEIWIEETMVSTRIVLTINVSTMKKLDLLEKSDLTEKILAIDLPGEDFNQMTEVVTILEVEIEMNAVKEALTNREEIEEEVDFNEMNVLSKNQMMNLTCWMILAPPRKDKTLMITY
jgi:hypothetical protein